MSVVKRNDFFSVVNNVRTFFQCGEVRVRRVSFSHSLKFTYWMLTVF